MTSASNELIKNHSIGFLDLDDLKLLAILAMTADHVAATFLNTNSIWYLALRCVGRITGPVMFFAAVEGYHKTSDLGRYLKRLVLFGLISQLPYALLFNSPLRLNVLFTILCGLLAITIARQVPKLVHQIVLLSLLLPLTALTDWGYFGVLIMLVFDRFYQNYQQQAMVYMLLIALNNGFLKQILSPITSFCATGKVSWFLEPMVVVEFLGLCLPIILLRFYSSVPKPQKSKLKWFFYIYYPGHLLILWLIKVYLF